LENVDITSKVKNFIRFGLAGLLILSGAIGYGVFQHYHAEKILQIENAKVTSNIISIHALTNGKIKELPFADGAEVKAGDVIARIEVSITEEEIKKLQQAVDAAKQNYDSLKLGQRVKTPVRRTKPAATTPAPSTPARKNTASVSTLEERVKRMEELYEMGAVSKGELDKAKQDLSKARTAAPTPATPAPSQSQTVEIDFVDSIQPTPPAILQNAENAVKEAELALNVAVEQSKQTEITAPVDGVIYYNFAADEEIKAGDVIAKIGDDKNVWIEAEVTEEIFNQVALGKKVSYAIDGHNLSGTVTEKIAPAPPEPEKLEEVTAEETAENKTAETSDTEKPAETATPETSTEKTPPPEQVKPEQTAEENNSETAENKTEVTEEKTAEEVAEPEPEKYLLKVSIPADRDFDLKLLSETTLKISL